MGNPVIQPALEGIVEHWKSINWTQRSAYLLSILVLYVLLATGSEEVTTQAKPVETIQTKAPIPWQGPNSYLCEEPGNVVADAQHPHAHLCKCTDPITPIPQNRKEWKHHHETMVQDVKYHGSKPIDVVLLGDSLIEHWNGTHRWGTTKTPTVRELFEKLFTKRGGGSLDAMALGNSASTATNLLWQLNNGLLQDSINPKLWVLLIGTNDLVGTRCTTNVTTEAIVNVADTILQQKQNSSILIHGLLPRGEGGRQAMTLGKEWKRIQKVNHNLERIAKNRTNWFYWDTGNFFLNSNHKALDSRLIADGIHPRVTGLNLWGPRMVDAIQKVLNQIT